MKSTVAMLTLLLGLVMPVAASSQDPDARQSGNATARQPAEDARPSPSSNIRIQLTVTDTIGTAAPQKKSVSVIVADGFMGRIRSNRGAGNPANLNVDATPTLRNNGRVQLRLAMEYQPPTQGQSPTRYAAIDELVTVLLEPGKPTLVSEASDPSTDRRVTVEVVATVLK